MGEQPHVSHRTETVRTELQVETSGTFVPAAPVAQDTDRPQWNPGDFFGTAFTNKAP